MGYLDNAGLYVKIGPETATPKVAGEYKTYGELREVEVVLNLPSYAFGATNYIVDDTTVIPAGMRIQEVETYVDTVGVGATATFDLGLMRTDRTTVTSATAFLAAFPVGSVTPVGAKTVVTKAGDPFVGALVGTTTASVNHITIRVNTANFTAGVVRVRIRYYRP